MAEQISIRRVNTNDGTSQLVASNGHEHDREDISSLTKVPAVHALLEMAYDGTLREYGFLETDGAQAVAEFVDMELDNLRAIALHSRNDRIYALCYKYGGPREGVEEALGSDGDVRQTRIFSMAHSDDPYGVTGADPRTARIATVVERMNRIAENAGATNTRFVTPHGHTGGWDMNNWGTLGWPEPDDMEGEAASSLRDHHSTADDMSLMTARFLSEFPNAYEEVFSHRHGRHTLDDVLDAQLGFDTSEEGAFWRSLGGKSGTGYGFQANGEQLAEGEHHPRGGRFHGQTVYAEYGADGELTGHYMVITVTGVGRNRGDRVTRDTLLKGLQRSVWTANGAPPIAEEDRVSQDVMVASVTAPPEPEAAVLAYGSSFDVCDVAPEDIEPFSPPARFGGIPGAVHEQHPFPSRRGC